MSGVINVALVLAMIVAASVGNLMLKVGSNPDRLSTKEVSFFVNWLLFGGLALFAVSALAYVFLLRRLPLNVAQSMMAGQFLAVILCAHFFLNEPMSVLRWSGVAFIAGGIILVGISESSLLK